MISSFERMVSLKKCFLLLLILLFQVLSYRRAPMVHPFLHGALCNKRSLAHYFPLPTRQSNLKATVNGKTANLIFDENDSDRLKKAKLRLAEVKGELPFGSSELIIKELMGRKEIKGQNSSIVNSWNATASSMINTLLSRASKSSQVREISWRVAEPEIQYDPAFASQQLIKQPVKWISRNLQIFVPITLFTMKVVSDILLNKEEERRPYRAQELLNIISSQSPALIKAGQALSSRPDLLPKDYLDALQQLQDRCPAFPDDQAFELFYQETGYQFFDVFELDSPHPIAAASIGQVYKGRLKSNGAKVAIKIQRPKCEESVAVDLFIMRWYANNIQQLLYKLLKRNLDLTSVIDDFGELLYREIDYRAEALNAQRFAELYANIPDVFVPKIYTSLSTRKVLTMEWVDGARLSDANALERMGLDGTKLVDILVKCSLRQMLDNGFFHADPHAGNLLAMANGKLCYLDFGMVSYVEASQRYSIIEAVVHMVNRDFNALAELYRRMGFIPSDVNTAPIVDALEKALPDVLNAPVGDFNFKNVISKLGDVMYKFPFSLPPFYIAIIRCLGVLEGLAIQVDSNFRIINDAYPYIASRLLTDPSDELQAALQQLLFKEGKLRWDRLEGLLSKANMMTDYDNSAAIDQLIKYIVSPGAKGIRENIATEIVSIFDTLETETVELFLVSSTGSSDASSLSLASIDWNQTIFNLWSIIQQYILSNGASGGNDVLSDKRLDQIINTFIKSIEEREKLKESMTATSVSKGYESQSQKNQRIKIIEENQRNIDSMRSFLRIISILRAGNREAIASSSVGRGAFINPPPATASSTTTSSTSDTLPLRGTVNPARMMQRMGNGVSKAPGSGSVSVFLRKIIREPVLQELIGRVISEISQRLATKTIRRVFGRSIDGN